VEPKKNIVNKAWNVIRNTVRLFIKHDTATMGAALAYYTVFSIAPVLIIVISVAGSLFGQDAIEGEVKRELQNYIGSQSALQVQEMIKSAYKPGENLMFTAIATIILVISATAVFTQLRSSLDTIWEVKPGKKKPILTFLTSRIFSLAMIACLVFLLMVSMILNTILEAFTNYLHSRVPEGWLMVMNWVDYIVSWGTTIFLFAFIYKFMSDAKLQGRNVWFGAIFTAVLFLGGKYLIALYLSTSNIADTYGASGSIVVLLLWVFYSSQILFFGAEFTHALAVEQGVSLAPGITKPNAQTGIVDKTVMPETE
jgi:membrane protein